MRIGWLRVELRIQGARSLKDKRRPLRSLQERLRGRFNVSVAEVAHQDNHQLAVIGLAVAASSGEILARELQRVVEFITQNPDCQVLDIRQDSIGAGEMSSRLTLE
ncbi:MAG: DUF503 domain-containing protein [Planctomycetota bacterium]|jgi:uncharacterized protein YlxP (DUF503 family)|nr:DUF503 domain-containing protein [Planctomycetota bacterium]